MGNKPGVKWSRVLIDVCTQRDYLDTGGILQVGNRELLIANLRQIFNWVKLVGLGVVSSVESHRPTEMPKGFPLHCIDDTPGQKKPSFALVEPWCLVEADNYLSLPPDLTTNYRQVIFRKRGRDVLGNPKADRFLTHLAAEEFIICGVGLERAIKSLALGLLARHKHVTVVTDACGFWSPADAELSSRQLAAKGIHLVSTEELVKPPVVVASRPKIRVAAVRNRHHPAPARSRTRATADAENR
jgi:nicotinamidase-related amidase